MLGRIDFRYDAADEIVFATPRHGASTQTDEAATVEEAVEVIKAARRAAGV